MPIRIDDNWRFEGTPVASERRVYRDALLIGRVRRWREQAVADGPNREWFTAERWKADIFVPIEGQQSDFDEALQRLVFYGVAN